MHAVGMIGEFGVCTLVVFEPCHPDVAQRLSARADARLEVFAHPVGDEKLRFFRPTVTAFGQPDFLLAQRLAVGRAGVLLVGRAVGDVTVDNDESRAVAWCS